jgi:hypothetical protein
MYKSSTEIAWQSLPSLEIPASGHIFQLLEGKPWAPERTDKSELRLPKARGMINFSWKSSTLRKAWNFLKRNKNKVLTFRVFTHSHFTAGGRLKRTTPINRTCNYVKFKVFPWPQLSKCLCLLYATRVKFQRCCITQVYLRPEWNYYGPRAASDYHHSNSVDTTSSSSPSRWFCIQKGICSSHWAYSLQPLWPGQSE